MNNSAEKRVDQTITIGTAVLLAVMGLPAVLYFTLSHFVGAFTANIVALATSLLAALTVIYVFRRAGAFLG
ncbi:hypothetical protein SAMN05421858_4872 [Haladaptatus litoreus]|uniref:Uncharacterized protein n=1 Tax=Haladaptatus litoreus TaxID=553468 RepID=A0A1N7FA94_9EURY|nr:hypothetical protein SAMN05421858_4872 [Haladaptatus litoreus]